jgi:uncharacterized protein YjaG (DUF416 family)
MVIDNIPDLEKLDYQKQLVFAYLTCERLYPNYAFFSNNFDFGDKEVLREAIDFIYNALLMSNFSKEEETKSFLNIIDINTPFPHNFNTALASSALDASSVILETLNFMLDKNASRLNDISMLATDTVDMYIHDRDNLDFNTDPQFEYKILNDPLMQRELNTQKGIINYLTKINDIALIDINYLLDLQYNNHKGNIDLS